MGSRVKIKCGLATGIRPDSAQSPSAEALKSYDNKIRLFLQEATLREHSTCSSIYWNLHWDPPGNGDPALATDRGKQVGYWTAGETCKEASQNQKNIFPRKLTTARASMTLTRSGGLAAPETQVLSPFHQYSTRITAHSSSQHIFHQSGWVNFWKTECIQSLVFLLPQQTKKSILGLDVKGCSTENC